MVVASSDLMVTFSAAGLFPQPGVAPRTCTKHSDLFLIIHCCAFKGHRDCPVVDNRWESCVESDARGVRVSAQNWPETAPLILSFYEGLLRPGTDAGSPSSFCGIVVRRDQDTFLGKCVNFHMCFAGTTRLTTIFFDSFHSFSCHIWTLNRSLSTIHTWPQPAAFALVCHQEFFFRFVDFVTLSQRHDKSQQPSLDIELIPIRRSRCSTECG
mmetsp:Transcript_28846/g.42424  ORF Transcript_28846/g.42424 Transcript_28846/m.42424 type:complete len:212 (-) Transcript_28846:966-1601(-)